MNKTTVNITKHNRTWIDGKSGKIERSEKSEDKNELLKQKQRERAERFGLKKKE